MEKTEAGRTIASVYADLADQDLLWEWRCTNVTPESRVILTKELAYRKLNPTAAITMPRPYPIVPKELRKYKKRTP